jgi:3-dehydroquinate synthase
MAVVEAKTRGHRCPIVVTADGRERLQKLVRQHLAGGQLFVVYDAQLFALHGRDLQRSLGPIAARSREFALPVGERAKSATTLAAVYDFLLEGGVCRGDLVLACGGGVTTDLVGYAAATILRGVRWAAVPTTLLGMVDAAIGGKTAINHSRGKNLIGAFWQPEFVHCDLQYLKTLDRRQMVAGWGEILKYAGLCGNRAPYGGTLDALESASCSGDFYDPKRLARLVLASASYKALIVEKDERDQGLRMRLNYGHTFAHAIEQAVGLGRLLHGEAVILGVVAALRLGQSMGYRSEGLERYLSIAESFVRFLPKRRLRQEAIRTAMELDKKRSDGQARFVLIEQLGRPILCDNIQRRHVDAALADMALCYARSGGRDASNCRH